MTIEFYKYQANGNDFILIEDFKKRLKNLNRIAKKLCMRKLSIGADGLIILENSDVADFRMRIFNADGTEAEMCGNGLSCAALHFYLKRKKSKQKVETLAGIKIVEVLNGYVKIDMGKPIFDPDKIPAISNNKFFSERIYGFKVYAVNTGVPHAVIFVDNIESIDVKEIGRKIRHHPLFPKGTNVNFVKKVRDGEYFVRTYERGVEDETLSCGTGLCAVSSVVHMLGLDKKERILLRTKGGEVYVEVKHKNNEIEKIYLYNKPVFVFKGEISEDYLY